MTKVVIDTNVFVSSFFGGIPRKIIDLWRDGEITLCLSQEIVEEYVKVLRRLGVSHNEIRDLMSLFAENYHAIFTSKTPKISVVEDDPDDDKFIECAVALNCKIVVSGDRHLRSIRKYIDIEILSPREFIEKMT